MLSALSIAGSDPTGGAGLQADLQVFRSFGVHGGAVPTALTIQDGLRIRQVLPVFPSALLDMLRVTLTRCGPRPSRSACSARTTSCETCCWRWRPSRELPVVIDPVLAASDGSALLERRAYPALRDLAFGRTLLTPNWPEAEILIGEALPRRRDGEAAARSLLEDLQLEGVLLKGGHLDGDADDLLVIREGDRKSGSIVSKWLPGERIPGDPVHGTGCALSAAIAAGLALGRPLEQAVVEARAVRANRHRRRASAARRTARGSSAIHESRRFGAEEHSGLSLDGRLDGRGERARDLRARARARHRRARPLERPRSPGLERTARLLRRAARRRLARLRHARHRSSAGSCSRWSVFLALIVVHDRCLGHEAREQRVRRFFEDGLARLDARLGGARRCRRSLSRPAASLRPGSRRLRDGLALRAACDHAHAGRQRPTRPAGCCEPADPETIRERQAAIEELRPRLAMRLEMAIAGDESGSATQQAALESWAAAPAAALPRVVFPLAMAASLVSLGGLGLWIFGGVGPGPFLAAICVQGGFALALRSRVRPVLAAAEAPVGSLARTASLLACIENERFDSPLLARLGRELETTGRTPSGEFEALRRLVDRRDARNNQFFAPIAALLLWGTHAALALERWRARCGPRLSVWIESAGEIEALCALSSYAYEHPDDPFAEIVEPRPDLRRRRPRPSAAARATGLRSQRPAARASDRPRARDERLEHVRQEHDAAHRRLQHDPGLRRRAGAGRAAARLAAAASRHRSGSSTRCRRASPHFMAEIMRLRQVVELSAAHARRSSCSTRSCTAPTRTTAGSARRP